MAFDDTRFWFGEHDGERLADIPVKYLDWFIGAEWDSPSVQALKAKVTEHLKGRPDWHALDDDEDYAKREDDAPDVCPKCAEDLTPTGWCVGCAKYPYGKKG